MPEGPVRRCGGGVKTWVMCEKGKAEGRDKTDGKSERE